MRSATGVVNNDDRRDSDRFLAMDTSRLPLVPDLSIALSLLAETMLSSSEASLPINLDRRLLLLFLAGSSSVSSDSSDIGDDKNRLDVKLLNIELLRLLLLPLFEGAAGGIATGGAMGSSVKSSSPSDKVTSGDGLLVKL